MNDRWPIPPELLEKVRLIAIELDARRERRRQQRAAKRKYFEGKEKAAAEAFVRRMQSPNDFGKN